MKKVLMLAAMLALAAMFASPAFAAVRDAGIGCEGFRGGGGGNYAPKEFSGGSGGPVVNGEPGGIGGKCAIIFDEATGNVVRYDCVGKYRDYPFKTLTKEGRVSYHGPLFVP